jgi:hypothetical protein
MVTRTRVRRSRRIRSKKGRSREWLTPCWMTPTRRLGICEREQQRSGCRAKGGQLSRKRMIKKTKHTLVFFLPTCFH